VLDIIFRFFYSCHVMLIISFLFFFYNKPFWYSDESCDVQCTKAKPVVNSGLNQFIWGWGELANTPSLFSIEIRKITHTHFLKKNKKQTCI